MRCKKVCVLILFLLSFLSAKNVLADELCSSGGYTVITINGIFNDEIDAIRNKNRLEARFNSSYKSEPLFFDYLYNPTHLAGLGDLIDVLQQGILGEVSDYDLVEMINDASGKVKTQKVLLVAHSQGNFYANNFYEQLASKQGGVPEESLGVYGVASPAQYVAGGGRYVTSDTDKVITDTVASYIEILPPNIHIPLSEEKDDNGHSFSDVYLKYQSGRIVSDIKYSLSKLRENDEQEPESPCIAILETSTLHEVKSAFFFLADPLANIAKDGIKDAYRVGVYLADKTEKVGSFLGKILKDLLAGAGGSLEEDIFVSEDLNLVSMDSPGDNGEEETKKKEENENKITVVYYPEPIKDIQTEEQKEIAVSVESAKSKSRRSGGGSGNPKENEEIPVVVDPVPETEPEPENPEPEDPGPINPNPEDTDPEDELEEENLSFSDLNNNQIADKDEEEVETAVDQFLLPGEYFFKNLIVSNASTLVLKGDSSSPNDFKGVKIYAENIIVKSGSRISADKEGYGPRSGPGAGEQEEWGGSYGGTSAGNLNDMTYGSAVEPVDLGSGGAPTHSGGGAMYFVVSGIFENNGEVSADGDRSSSGGSIYIDVNNLTGDGVFRANGGGLYFTNYFKSPGSGGRVAIHYDSSSFSGEAEAKGGCGSYDGWTRACSEDGTVGLFDNTNNDLSVFGSSWHFISDDMPFSFNNIYFDEQTKVTSDDGVSVNADSLFIEGGSKFILAQNQELKIKNILLDGGSFMIFSGNESTDVDSIEIKGNSEISVESENLLLIEAKTLSIENGSKIDADALGYGIMSGPGAPSLELDGASHGGLGYLAEPTSLYGSKEEPEDFGSGGRGNHAKGGGAIKLVIGGVLKNDGVISANGDITSSGGSVYIKTEIFEGSGVISAKGGGSYCPGICYGPGGGGRIAIYFDESSFSGSVSASGWGGFGGASEDGTIYIPDGVSTDPDPNPDPNNPNITEYTLNGNAEDLTINPLEEPVSLAFTANKNVLWISLKIESEVDSGVYKYFYPGDDCDNKNVCAETWNGDLSSDKDLLDGIYKIKIHLKDSENREFDDYLPSHKIIVETIQEPVPLMSPTEETKIELEFAPEPEPEPEPEMELLIEAEIETETGPESDEEIDSEISPEEDGGSELEGEQGEDMEEEEIPPEV